MEIPPRARGRERAKRDYPKTGGNTPACAGKSPSAVRARLVPRKYPRVRGEERCFTPLGLFQPEIPPRARGRDYLLAADAVHVGNTPACAGKRRWIRIVRRGLWKYPRVRGEEGVYSVNFAHCSEIPPRARGRGGRIESPTMGSGNTPACAGKSRPPHRPRAHIGKYPRVRGEEIGDALGANGSVEIPPRARGRVRRCSSPARPTGNTPACAGKSLSDLQILTGVIQFLSGPAG